FGGWLRGQDLNLGPSGYEPDELPGCSTPRRNGLRLDDDWVGVVGWAVWRAWRRPTLPRLEAQYHRRRGFSRPSSGWDRVFCPSLWPPGRSDRLPESRYQMSDIRRRRAGRFRRCARNACRGGEPVGSPDEASCAMCPGGTLVPPLRGGLAALF